MSGKNSTATSDLCTACVLPPSFPNIQFDESGVCSFCRAQEPETAESYRARQQEMIDKTIKKIRGKYEYDALCCYSGGKDSSYMLKYLKEKYGLRILSFTLDNGFITEEVKRNINRLVDALGIDHFLYRPSQKFISKMYRAAIVGTLHGDGDSHKTRISDVCLACISVVNTQAARIALQKRIPTVFAGFTAGQIPKAVIKNYYKHYQRTFEAQKDRISDVLGEEASIYFGIPESDFDVYQISPNLAINVSEREIIEDLKSLDWIPPKNLDGCTSNCSLNALANQVHQKKYGFHPYAAELSILIRRGLMTRDEAIEKLNRTGAAGNVKFAMGSLGLSQADYQKL